MSKTPIVRPVSIVNTSITLFILALFALVGYWLGHAKGVAIGSLVYVVLSILLRYILASYQRKAIRYCKRQLYEQAIPEFQRSLAFFQNHEWIDRFRAVTMLSAAGMSYREMAMLGLGFCYAQIGDGVHARMYYEQCVVEFPDNEMAKAALRLMDAGTKSQIAS